jgi:hypothetical protein
MVRLQVHPLSAPLALIRGVHPLGFLKEHSLFYQRDKASQKERRRGPDF